MLLKYLTLHRKQDQRDQIEISNHRKQNTGKRIEQPFQDGKHRGTSL